MMAGEGQTPAMGTLMDQVEAEIVCRQCGHKVKKSVSWLTENDRHACPMCGRDEDLTSDEWKAKIRSYVDACSDFDS